MTSELKRAAERLRENVYHMAGEQRLDDLEAVADFALPLLDEKPITEEWLIGIGFRKWKGDDEDLQYDLWIPMQDELGWQCRLAYQSNGFYAVRMVDDVEEFKGIAESVELTGTRNRIPTVTRGRVRLLCLSLGIDLREPENRE